MCDQWIVGFAIIGMFTVAYHLCKFIDWLYFRKHGWHIF